MQPNGYGRRKVGGKAVLTHRHAYEQAHGSIPGGMVVHHKCHERDCINPEHLALLTREENARTHKPSCDCSSCRPVKLTRCKRGHDLRGEGKRDTTGQCRTCSRVQGRRRMRQYRAEGRVP